MSNDNVQQSRDDLLQRSRDEHRRLEAILADLSDEQMSTLGVTPGWAVKDHLAHITWWEQRVISVLARSEPDPVETMPIESKDTDTINAYVFAQNRGRPLSEVRTAFDASYHEMLQLIATAPDDLPADRWGWIDGNSASHYEEHRQMLEAWLGRA
jgi:hypothetical protein